MSNATMMKERIGIQSWTLTEMRKYQERKRARRLEKKLEAANAENSQVASALNEAKLLLGEALAYPRASICAVALSGRIRRFLDSSKTPPAPASDPKGGT